MGCRKKSVGILRFLQDFTVLMKREEKYSLAKSFNCRLGGSSTILYASIVYVQIMTTLLRKAVARKGGILETIRVAQAVVFHRRID